jgi:hypothetical protein
VVQLSPRHKPFDETIRDPLPGLRDQLETEYADVASPDTIDRIAKRALEEFDDARIREFVPVFAWRRARELLRTPSV